MKSKVGKLEGEARGRVRLEHDQSESSSTPTRGTLPSPFSPPGPHLLSVGWESMQIVGQAREARRAGERKAEITYRSQCNPGRLASDPSWFSEQSLLERKEI